MNRLVARALLGLAVVLTGATQLSCSVNDYCLNCATGDGGHGSGDAGVDADSGTDADIDAGCVPTGTEICDGKDNDCNGLIDDGVLPGVGDLCPNQMGECAGGVQQCENGALTCTKKPSPEVCDNLDNDCNGLTDEGDPGGGSKCGTDQGECVTGANHCVNGTIQCTGAIGGTMPPYGTAETCNAKDDDCDGNFDEGLTNLGTCGITNTGECSLGTLTCVGGQVVCQGAVNPIFETCNNKDDDCNGIVDDGYNKATDPQNCGTCGNVCMLPHATPLCSFGMCTIPNGDSQCLAGYHNNNNNPTDGCEYGPCFASGAEVCDGVDNDCDGQVDEDLVTPAICASAGECAGSTAMCTGAGGWKCNYGPTVSTDGNGNIVPETLCDGKDNDCNNVIDDHQPNKGVACDDGGLGVCKGTGTYQCDASDLNGPAVCVITTPGQTASAEACNNKDDDCDGVVDNTTTPGVFPGGGLEWIDIGGGHQMMRFEASKPDATAADVGTVTAQTCAKAGVQPWINVTYPQAVAACAAVGATLCTESEWHQACSVVTPSTYPIALGSSGTITRVVEAEDYSAIAPATDTNPNPDVTHSWVEDYTPGFSGISAMKAIPDSGSSLATTDIATMGPRLDYTFQVNKASTYHIWALLFSPNSNGNRVAITVDGGALSSSSLATTASNNSWQWRQPTNTFTLGVGTHTVSVYMVRDGVRLDAVAISDDTVAPAAPANGKGHKWAYATNPDTYQSTTCNGQDYTALNDNVLTTGYLGGGSLTSCYANISSASHAFDMSGNVKEWVRAQQPGQNPIRGGASNNTADGISCPLNFTLADDTFYFPNVGFRCCK